MQKLAEHISIPSWKGVGESHSWWTEKAAPKSQCLRCILDNFHIFLLKVPSFLVHYSESTFEVYLLFTKPWHIQKSSWFIDNHCPFSVHHEGELLVQEPSYSVGLKLPNAFSNALSFRGTNFALYRFGMETRLVGSALPLTG